MVSGEGNVPTLRKEAYRHVCPSGRSRPATLDADHPRTGQALDQGRQGHRFLERGALLRAAQCGAIRAGDPTRGVWHRSG